MLRRSLALLAAAPLALAAAPAALACDDGRLRADVRGAEGEERIAVFEEQGRPQIVVTSARGRVLEGFFAFDPGFRGGVDVATGDLDGDGREEVIVGAGAGGEPRVRVFDGRGNVVSDFFAFDPSFTGGVRVGAHDIDGDGVADVVVGRGVADAGRVHAFTGGGLALGTARGSLAGLGAGAFIGSC